MSADALAPTAEPSPPGLAPAVLKEFHRLEPARNAVALVFVSSWAAAVALGHVAPSWPVRALEWLVAGSAIHALAILMHEGSHGNLFRRPALDRWSAFFCGAPALLSATAYRVVHLEHHRHLRTPADPEEFTAFTNHPWVHAVLFWVWAAVGGASYVLLVPINGLALGRRSERIAILLDYALLGALYAALLSAAGRWGFRSDLLHGLVIPWGAAVVYTNVRGWAEHAMTRGGEPVHLSRVVTSNGLVAFLMLGSNYHLVHHLYPAVPWYNLKKLYRLLESDLREAGASIYGSYFRFLRDAVHAGVHGVAAGDGLGRR